MPAIMEHLKASILLLFFNIFKTSLVLKHMRNSIRVCQRISCREVDALLVCEIVDNFVDASSNQGPHYLGCYSTSNEHSGLENVLVCFRFGQCAVKVLSKVVDFGLIWRVRHSKNCLPIRDPLGQEFVGACS